MVLKDFYKKYENCIVALAWLLLLLLFVGIRYDYYYDLNDDVTIKDLMAGVYTGVWDIFMPVPVWLPMADSKKELRILPTDVGKSLPGRGRVVDGNRPFFGTFGFCAVYCGLSPAFGNSGFFVRYGKKRGLGRKLYQSKCAKRPFGCFIFPTAD